MSFYKKKLKCLVKFFFKNEENKKLNSTTT